MTYGREASRKPGMNSSPPCRRLCATGLNTRKTAARVSCAAIAACVRYMDHMATMLTALKSDGLEIIGLKGIYLLDNVYENVGLRSL